MSENPQNDESLADAFRQLGENLVQTLRTAWDTPERKKLQQEVEESLVDLSATVKNELNCLMRAPRGSGLKQTWRTCANVCAAAKLRPRCARKY